LFGVAALNARRRDPPRRSDVGGTFSTSLGWTRGAEATFSTSLGWTRGAEATFSTSLGWTRGAEATFSTSLGFASLRARLRRAC
jgi:hypothetical protein